VAALVKLIFTQNHNLSPTRNSAVDYFKKQKIVLYLVSIEGSAAAARQTGIGSDKGMSNGGRPEQFAHNPEREFRRRGIFLFVSFITR
jgi:hypothetical protein